MKNKLFVALVMIFILGCEKNGPVIEKYPDGKIKSETVYFKNKRHGIEKVYWPGGKTRSQIMYQNGKAQGQASFYKESGDLWIIQEYQSGKLLKSKLVE